MLAPATSTTTTMATTMLRGVTAPAMAKRAFAQPLVSPSPHLIRRTFVSTAARPLPGTGHRPRPTPSSPSSPYYSGGSLVLCASFLSFFGLTSSSSQRTAAAKDLVSQGAQIDSQSSTIVRAASPAAPRAQATTLFFVSVRGKGRKEWQDWIQYFREAGFDVIDGNVDASVKGVQLKEGDDEKVLADELASQVRLSSLQRQPLLFAQLDPSSSIFSSSAPNVLSLLHSHVHSQPSVSGIVLIGKRPGEGDAEGQDKLKQTAEKLGGRVKVVENSEQGLRESEAWLVEQGF
ncbi:unnamed protein product [Jaminaea pallidilutea]